MMTINETWNGITDDWRYSSPDEKTKEIKFHLLPIEESSEYSLGETGVRTKHTRHLPVDHMIIKARKKPDDYKDFVTAFLRMNEIPCDRGGTEFLLCLDDPGYIGGIGKKVWQGKIQSKAGVFGRNK